MINFLSILLLFAISPLYAIEISNNLQLQGFLSQGAFHTTANNVYGKSHNAISTQLTEIGLNLNYQIIDRLAFNIQGIFRDAGNSQDNGLNLDYAVLDVNLHQSDKMDSYFRLGRVKNPLGLYNETRDVAFTTPTIFLPSGVYFDRSRRIYLSSDGIQILNHLYNENTTWLFKINYGLPQNDNEEIEQSIFGQPTDGNLYRQEPALIAQLRYEYNAGQYIAAISYANVSLYYNKKPSNLFLEEGSVQFKPWIFSLQYNQDKLSLTGEYYYSPNVFKNFGRFFPDTSPTTESWYLQASYLFYPDWKALLRYDLNFLDKSDRNGKKSFTSIGQAAHKGYSKDWTFALRWDISSQIMLRTEYHIIEGTSWISNIDNPPGIKTEKFWELFALQLSLRF